MVSATTAAPYREARDAIRANRESGPSPSSKFTELSAQRPPSTFSPASSTCGSVESSTIGSVEAVASRLAISVMSATPSRPT
jgi:hypothetical protein